MSPNSIVLAQLEVSDCTAELYLNGIPLMRLAPPKLPLQNIAAEQHLVPGVNTLEAVIESAGQPSLALSGSREIAFRPMGAIARLIRFPEGVPGTIEHGELLGAAHFSWTEAASPRGAFPQSVMARIDMGPAHGRFDWQDAPRLRLDAATLAEANAVLDQVEAAIRSGDEERLWRLTEHQRRDLLRAYPAVTEAFLRNHLVTLLQHQRKAADPLIPRSRSKHDFRLVAGGRMLQCIDADWTSSIKLRDPGTGDALQYHLFLARIGATLQIVR